MQVNTSVLQKRIPGVVKKDYFNYLQASLIIILTLAICISSGVALGKYYFWTDLDIKRIKEQVVYLETITRSEPKKLENRVALAYSYFLLGRADDAIKELNKVIEIDKKYYAAYYNLGLIYNNEDRLDDALEVLQKAVEISPKDYKSYLQEGIVLRKMGKYTQATKMLQKADKLAPKNADVIYEAGMVAEAQGQKEAAIEIFKEALKYDPLFKEAKEALKRLQ